MTSTFNVGDAVVVSLFAAGPITGRPAGYVDGIVLGTSANEYDVLVHPGEDMEDLEYVLGRCDMKLSDLREGPVHVLRNIQPEELKRPARRLGCP